jgi:hypothetical protein
MKTTPNSLLICTVISTSLLLVALYMAILAGAQGEIRTYAAYGWLLLTCTLYAVFLNVTDWGRALKTRRAWLTVIIGNVMLLMAVAVIADWTTVQHVLLVNVIGGAPVVIFAVADELGSEDNMVRRVVDGEQ